MNLSTLQIALSILALFMLFQGLLKYVRHEQRQTIFKVAMTIIIWGGILTLTIVPSFSHTVTRKLGFGDNLNTLIFLGFVATSLVITKLIRVIERVESNISEIVRKEALEKINQSKK